MIPAMVKTNPRTNEKIWFNAPDIIKNIDTTMNNIFSFVIFMESLLSIIKYFRKPRLLSITGSRGRGFRFSPRNSSISHKLFPVLLGIRTNYGTYLP